MSQHFYKADFVAIKDAVYLRLSKIKINGLYLLGLGICGHSVTPRHTLEAEKAKYGWLLMRLNMFCRIVTVRDREGPNIPNWPYGYSICRY